MAKEQKVSPLTLTLLGIMLIPVGWSCNTIYSTSLMVAKNSAKLDVIEKQTSEIKRLLALHDSQITNLRIRLGSLNKHSK